jgi:hypothetical protein
MVTEAWQNLHCIVLAPFSGSSGAPQWGQSKVAGAGMSVMTIFLLGSKPS